MGSREKGKGAIERERERSRGDSKEYYSAFHQ